MANTAIDAARLLFRSSGLVGSLVLLASCGGGSDTAPQLNDTLSSNAPPPQSAPPPTSTRVASAEPTPVGSAQPPAIRLDGVTATPGAIAPVNVFLMSRGQQITGAQTDLSFPTGARVVARGDGRPDCWVNADINKNATSFVFLPNFCSGAACTGLRAIVWASDNVDPIADGSNLFVCKVQIDFDAGGTLILKTSQVIMSDPTGRRIDAQGMDGVITLSGEPLPTPFPTPTRAAGVPAVVLDRIMARPGATVDLTARLVTNGASISGVVFDIGFPPEARISAKASGKPLCAVNPDIEKSATSYAFRPNGCVGTDCTAFRTVVLSTDTVDPIADGSVLITCRMSIASDAEGPYPLTISGVLMTDPSGARVDAMGMNGLVTVSGAPIPTETPMPTSAPEPSAPAGTPTPLGPLTHSSIVLSQVSGTAGTTVMFNAMLVFPDHEIIAGAQNDIHFPIGAQVRPAADGRPDCSVNADINKNATSFSFQPPSCGGADCIGMRAIVISLTNPDPIPSGAVLYTCRLEIAPTAAGALPLAITGVVMSDPDGNRTPDADGVDGAIIVGVP